MDSGVTVIIPTHDRWSLLQRALASVSSQTVAAAEVIVVDDASTDGTADRLETLAVPRTRVIRLTEKGGAAHARNRGIDEATGRFVTFLDSDDEWLPTYLETMLAGFELKPRPIAVCSAQQVRRPGGHTVNYRPKLTGDAFEPLLSFRTRICIGIVADKRALGSLRFDESLPALQDRDLLVELSRRGSIASSDEPLYIQHRDGSDHLADATNLIRAFAVWMEKYESDLAARPRALANNHFRLARLYQATGDRKGVRDQLLSASDADPGNLRFLALGIPARLGPKAAETGLALFLRLAWLREKAKRQLLRT